jgi:transcriptional regulator GlxA family with amidase domain
MPRQIVIVAYPGFELLDLAGPASAFANAGASRYRVTVAARAAGHVASSAGVGVVAACDLAHAPRGIDTLLVVGGEGTRALLGDTAFVEGVRRLAARSARVASVCSGAFVLAAAGLLDGRRATTHWRWAEALARGFPRVRVEPDAIFVRDDPVWTSAGVTAGLDLALALVEADHGRALALSIARELVVFLKRPGGQSQFSLPLATQTQDDQPLVDRLRQQVLERPQAAWTVARMAERVHVSERHLRRLFRRGLSMGPREFVQRARLEHAQRLLGESDASVREVARRCGYATADAFRRRFAARFGVAPADWRARFQANPTE